MDTIVLYGKDDPDGFSISLPAGPSELVQEEIDRIINAPENAWAVRYEFYSSGVQVDDNGFQMRSDEL